MTIYQPNPLLRDIYARFRGWSFANVVSALWLDVFERRRHQARISEESRIAVEVEIEKKREAFERSAIDAQRELDEAKAKFELELSVPGNRHEICSSLYRADPSHDDEQLEAAE